MGSHAELFRLFGVDAKLLIQEPGGVDDSLAELFRMWASEVAHCVDVAPDGNEEPHWIYDYEGTIGTREWIDRKLATLPPDLRIKVEDWLAGGTDKRFIELTEPDTDRLLRRADLVTSAPVKPWRARIPKRGQVRVELEYQARCHDQDQRSRSIVATDDASLWRPDPTEGEVHVVLIDGDLALVVDDERGDLTRVGVTACHRTQDGWAYVFSDMAGDGDYTGAGPHESSGWDSDIAWIIGRDVARAVIAIEYRGTTTHTRANDDGWWAFFRLARETGDPDVYSAPERVRGAKAASDTE